MPVTPFWIPLDMNQLCAEIKAHQTKPYLYINTQHGFLYLITHMPESIQAFEHKSTCTAQKSSLEFDRKNFYRKNIFNDDGYKNEAN